MKKALIILLFSLVLSIGCERASETSEEEIDIEVTAFPLSLPADGLSQAVIWATVQKGGKPCNDSTLVQFAATRGVIDASAYTKDGLASVTVISDSIPGISVIVGYVELITDSVNINMGTID
ncbi:MAG: hypothetical protein ACLFSQ_00925 [Candidatus Zixiibacteriota bacterium]